MKPIYFDAIRELQEKGVNFEKDVFTLSSSDRSQLDEAARKYGYRRPKTSYFARGGAFFLCLQRLYNRKNK
jgi:hypothetical protein